MKMIQCTYGHYYDPGKSPSCPVCRKRKPKPDSTTGRPSTEPPAGGVPPVVPPADGTTVPMARRALGIDPVVGWLVCIEGADRGRDYRIRSERNTIGRAPAMDICIAGDDTISRETHAVVRFDPQSGAFKILSGRGRGLVYVNDVVVDAAAELKERDVVSLGRTKLLFVPLCDERFRWSGRPDAHST